MSTKNTLLLAATLTASACYWAPGPPEVVQGVRTVQVLELTEVQTEATLPTDLLPKADGGWLVLDGYRSRILPYDSQNQPLTPIGGHDALGAPVRIAEADDGYWLCDPGTPERHGAVLLVDEHGEPKRALAPDLTGLDDLDPNVYPVSAVQLDGELLIADRLGRLVWVDPETGEATKVLGTNVENERMTTLTDVLKLESGDVMAVETMGPRLHTINEDGEPQDWFGRFGLWVGSLKRPKSAAQTGLGNFLVADSALGAVQVFTADGAPMGVLAAGSEILLFEHPVAVRRSLADEQRFMVLDEMTGVVTSFTLLEAEEKQAQAAASYRFLRHALDTQDSSAAGQDGKNCRQCHDGFVNDNREHWDPANNGHPVDFEPERELPAFFPLDADGHLGCKACHSPHGIVSTDDAGAVLVDEDRSALARLNSEGVAFIRLDLEHSNLCVACHGEAAHEEAVQRLEISGDSHLVGEELVAALRKRPGWSEDSAKGWPGLPSSLTTSCLGCHDPHGAPTKPMLRSSDESTLCAWCHEEQTQVATNHQLGLKIGNDIPTPRKSAALITARDGGTMCRSCHDLVSGSGSVFLREPEDWGLLCVTCHDERKGVTSSAHGSVEGSNGIPCLGCHDVHGGIVADQLLRSLGAATQNDGNGCLWCHGEGRPEHVADMSPGKRGHPVLSDDDDLNGCSSCHDTHTPSLDHTPECGECHAEQGEADDRGGHGKADCLDCHPVHADPPRLTGTVPAANPVSLRCMACHSPFADSDATERVEDYEHPAPVFLPDGKRWEPLGGLPLYTPEGELAPPGENGELTCTSCHFVHGPGPDAKPALRRSDWEVACSACHGRESLILYRFFHQPERRPKTEGEP